MKNLNIIHRVLRLSCIYRVYTATKCPIHQITFKDFSVASIFIDAPV